MTYGWCRRIIDLGYRRRDKSADNSWYFELLPSSHSKPPTDALYSRNMASSLEMTWRQRRILMGRWCSAYSGWLWWWIIWSSSLGLKTKLIAGTQTSRDQPRSDRYPGDQDSKLMLPVILQTSYGQAAIQEAEDVQQAILRIRCQGSWRHCMASIGLPVVCTLFSTLLTHPTEWHITPWSGGIYSMINAKSIY